MANARVRQTQTLIELLLDESERDILLTALDFARSWLDSMKDDKGLAQSPHWYQNHIDPIEQVLAATKDTP